MKKIILLSSIFLILSSIAFSQSKREIRKIYKKAESLLADNQYKDAKPYYKKLMDADPKNQEYIFFSGICEFGTEDDATAIDLFNKIIAEYESSKKADSYTLPALYYRGKAYHNMYMFDNAIASFEELKKFDLNKDGKKTVEDAITQSTNGKKIFMSMKPIVVTRLAILNSPYNDHTPIPTQNGDKLFFTSTRDGGVGGDVKSPMGERFEDIWIWDKSKGLMSKPYNIKEPVNTSEHEATAGLSPDGKTLFIYKSSRKYAGDIYVSEMKDGKWTKPVKLSKKINKRRSVEKHASITPDGKTLYFSSDRRKGKGGRDIWVSTKNEKGEWEKPKSLDVINTKEDEEAPFILADGKTLYFSSKGHGTLGGYDIYKSVKQDDGSWSKPENIGFPINTVRDDVYYFPLADEKTAYYTRTRKGVPDIYRVQVYGADRNILLVKGIVKDNREYNNTIEAVESNGDTAKYNNMLFVKNKKIVNEDSVITVNNVNDKKIDNTVYFVPQSNAINVFDIKSNKNTDLYQTNSNLGDYKFLLIREQDNKIVYDAPEHIFDTKNIKADETINTDEIVYNPILVKIETGKTKKVKCTPFDANSTEFNSFTKKELELVAESLNKYSQLVVNFSTNDYLKPQNKSDVLEARQKAAVDFIKNKGIAEDRIYTDLSPNDIGEDCLEYTIYDTESVEKAKEEKEERKKVTPPDTTTVVVADKTMEINIENVYFNFNKYKLKVKENNSLNKLANYLKENTTARIKVVGYTDAVGSNGYNQKLSERRATAVVNYLKEKGANESQVELRGFGEDNPVTLNKKNGKWYEPAKQYNRRVEIYVLSQGDVKLTIKQLTTVPDKYKTKTYEINFDGK